MNELRARESVILASDFSAMIAWYQDVLGFKTVNLIEEGYHYCNLETASGIKLGIAAAEEMGVAPVDRANNSVILQFEVDDLRALFTQLEQSGASITGGPTFSEKDGFWFGSFADPEGNPFWVVDRNCP